MDQVANFFSDYAKLREKIRKDIPLILRLHVSEIDNLQDVARVDDNFVLIHKVCSEPGMDVPN